MIILQVVQQAAAPSILTNNALIGVIGFIISGLIAASLFLLKYIWATTHAENKAFSELLLERIDGFDQYVLEASKQTVAIQENLKELKSQNGILFRKSDENSEDLVQVKGDIIAIKTKIEIKA